MIIAFLGIAASIFLYFALARWVGQRLRSWHADAIATTSEPVPTSVDGYIPARTSTPSTDGPVRHPSPATVTVCAQRSGRRATGVLTASSPAGVTAGHVFEPEHDDGDFGVVPARTAGRSRRSMSLRGTVGAIAVSEVARQSSPLPYRHSDGLPLRLR